MVAQGDLVRRLGRATFVGRVHGDPPLATLHVPTAGRPRPRPRPERKSSPLTRPTLHVFAISHYCEKARWALDRLRIDYALSHLAPGLHAQITKELGAPDSSLPVLVSGNEVVQGSGSILSWADGHAASSQSPSRQSLSPSASFESACRDLEQRLDDGMGVHARRYFYSEAMVEYPESVQEIFIGDLPATEQAFLKENWGVVREAMITRMDLGRAQGEESLRIVRAELDWFESLLADGRRFLIDDRFSRADITAASLMAPLVCPPEHPTYHRLVIPPRAREELDEWAGRPCLEWVREIYRGQRQTRR